MFLKQFGFENNMIALILLMLFIGLMYSAWPQYDDLPDGVLVPGEPMQLETYLPELEKDGIKVRPMAFYTIKGRVLDKNTSFSSIISGHFDMSGANVLLGWKNMSDSTVLAKMSIRLKGRKVQAEPKSGFNIAESDYIGNLSYNHLIAANEQVQKQINDIREGDVIKVTGYLVELKNPKSPDPWRSSLSRFDKGDGAGEVIWVQDIQQIRFAKK